MKYFKIMISTKLIEEELKESFIDDICFFVDVNNFLLPVKREEEPVPWKRWCPLLTLCHQAMKKEETFEDLGTIEVSTKNVTFKVWVGGALVRWRHYTCCCK
jgi:hypothetical protein